MIFTPHIEPVPIAMDLETVLDDKDVPAHLVFVFTLGLPFPVSEQQIAVVPFGDIRVPIQKEEAEKYANQILVETEKLPKTSNIVRASSMAEAEQFINHMKQFGEK